MQDSILIYPIVWLSKKEAYLSYVILELSWYFIDTFKSTVENANALCKITIIFASQSF